MLFENTGYEVSAFCENLIDLIVTLVAFPPSWYKQIVQL